jgi:hypothetical protein
MKLIESVARTFPLASSATAIELPLDQPPILLVLVATEEEFDWSQDFDRDNTSVRAVRRLLEIQRLFDSFDIRPTYAVDYPVARQREAASVLRELAASRRAEIGAHLHPWVNPPFDEEVNGLNSFPGNLDAALEEKKLQNLVAVIEENLGVRPRSYLAGRYGIGPHTLDLLEREGFHVDLSVAPPFDYRDDGGPDFSRESPDPVWWNGRGGRLLRVPVTGAYVGMLGTGAHGLYQKITHRRLLWTRLASVLARLSVIERMRLSPEGHDLAAQIKLTRFLFERGTRVFTYYFHSPSLEPGCTPYVTSEQDLDRFHDTCRRYFEFFLRDLHGTVMTHADLRRFLMAREPLAASD